LKKRLRVRGTALASFLSEVLYRKVSSEANSSNGSWGFQYHRRLLFWKCDRVSFRSWATDL